MAELNDGGPAFPTLQETPDPDFPHLKETWRQEGMTLRDWFAGQALTGLISGRVYTHGRVPNPDEFANMAYGLADAMLAERERR